MTDVRPGGSRIRVRNSGREVWLYDDANLAAIRAFASRGAGGAPGNFPDLTSRGIVVGYSLVQDDDIDIAVYVGEPLTDSELAAARWLEPQTAFVRLPAGRLCVESNDASRIGPEQATESGATTDVAAGDYRVTLYRIDNEALFRESRVWDGPQELIVLTPGGDASHAVDDLLPFHERRDTNWVGRYTINGRKADALVWFDDYWDTFVLNLDTTAIASMSLEPGAFIRTNVPAAGLTLISTFAKSWQDAQKLPLPSRIDLSEFGYAAVQNMSDWGGAEALFCKREKAKTRVEAPHHYAWTPAFVEVLDVEPAAAKSRTMAVTQLESKRYFDDEFLAMVLSEFLPETEELEKLPLKKALTLLSKHLATLGLKLQGDYAWNERVRADAVDTSCRLYGGLPNVIACAMASDNCFEFFFLSELEDDTWILNGLADEMERRVKTKGPSGLFVDNPRVRFNTTDEPLGDIFAAHMEALGAERTRPTPVSPEESLAAFRRFLVTAFD